MESFYNHIILESILRREEMQTPPRILLEGQGIPHQLFDMVKAFLRSPQLEQAWNNKGTLNKKSGAWRITGDLYKFVKDVKGNFIGPKSYITIIVYDPWDENGSNGGEYEGAYEAEFDKETGLLNKASIRIRTVLSSNAPIRSLTAKLRSPLSHELLHAYEDFNRQCLHTERPYVKSLGDYITDRGYEGPGDVDDIMSWMNYLLNPAEQRAFIAQAALDVEANIKILDKMGRLDRIKDSRNIEDFIKTTNFWPAYEHLRHWINDTQWDRMPKFRQERYLEQYLRVNKGKGRIPKNYNQMVKALKFKWSQFDSNLKTRVSQAASRALVPPAMKDPAFPKNKLSESIIYQAF